ncbi:MAG: hypothetical protein H6601_07595 [Flavobacteriales bacterium]|nr:hypothetical protein [Flavobacteriales bacterium]
MKTTKLFLVAIATLSLAACSSTATNEEAPVADTTAVAPATVEIEPLDGASTDSTAAAEEAAPAAEVAH